MIIQVVTHGSPNYLDAVELRRRVLRFPLGLDYTAEQLDEERDERHTHLVMRDGGKTIGTLIITKIGDMHFKIRQVAVDPARQGEGLGTRLMDFAEAMIESLGGGRVTLHSRKGAEPFYLKLGYETQGPEFEEVGIPHVKMTKLLLDLKRKV